MKRIIGLIALLCLFLLGACGPTFVGKEVNIQNRFVLEDSDNNKFGADLTTTSGNMDQTSSQPTQYDIKLDAVIDWLEAKGFKDTAEAIKKVAGLGKYDPEVKVDDVIVEKINLIKFVDEDGNPGANGGKIYGWLGRKGEDIPGPIEVAIKGCGTYTIPDPSMKWTPDGNLENHNQFVWFSGDPSQQEDTNNGLASIVAGPDCQEETIAIISYAGSDPIL